MSNINLPGTEVKPALKVKKAWQTPTVILLATGYVTGGSHRPGQHEAGSNSGKFFYTQPDTNHAYHLVPHAKYDQYNHS